MEESDLGENYVEDVEESHVEERHVEISQVEESHVQVGLIEESPCREESCRGECCRGESCRYIYIYRYIETVTSLPDRQCPEQGRFFFVVQDFVLGYVYIYLRAAAPAADPGKEKPVMVSAGFVRVFCESSAWMLYIYIIYIYASNSIYLYVEVKFC